MAFYTYPINMETTASQPSTPQNDELQPKKQNVTQQIDTNQAHVFIIPGILDEGKEAYNLAKALYTESNNKRLSYVYYDPALRASNQTPIKRKTNLKKKAQGIAKEMYEFQKNHPNLPIVILDYSFGCTLGYEVAKQLDNMYDHKKDIFLRQIDGAAPHVMQKYYSEYSDQAIDDIIHIINYAANMAGYIHTYMLYTAPNDSELDIQKIKELYEKQNGNPILIKQGQSIKVYGRVGTNDELTDLDNTVFHALIFPKPNQAVELKHEKLTTDMLTELKKGHNQPAIPNITRSFLDNIKKQKMTLAEQLNAISKLITGFDLALMSINSFDELTGTNQTLGNIPCLIKDNENHYKLFGRKEGNWQFTNLGVNLKLPNAWLEKFKSQNNNVFISFVDDIYSIIKQGHTLPKKFIRDNTRFQTYLKIAKENLESIENEEYTKPNEQETDKIHIKVISTASTREKFKEYTTDNYLGWSDYQDKVETLVPDNIFKNTSHIALLNQQNATILAHHIHQDIQNTLTDEYLIKNSTEILTQQIEEIFINKKLQHGELSESLQKALMKLGSVINTLPKKENEIKQKKQSLTTSSLRLFNREPDSSSQPTTPSPMIESKTPINEDMNNQLRMSTLGSSKKDN